MMILFSITKTSAQNGTEFLWNPTFQVNFKSQSSWSFNVGTAYRNTISRKIGDETGFESQHFQFSQGTGYKINSNNKLGLTLTYRFNSTFREDKGNEFRITEKYSFSEKYARIKIGHQLKADQRILADETTYRFRYRFQIVVPFTSLESDTNQLDGVFSTEALASYNALAKPEVDQRFTAGIEYKASKKTKLKFAAEYRFEDYFHDTIDRLFIYTGLVYSL